jgi:hemerythrin-like domain-containing protein
MNDPFEIIKKDHEIIGELFNEYESLESEDVIERNELVEKITRELLLHSEMENTLLYGQLREALEPHDSEFVEQAYAENEEIENLLHECRSLTTVSDDFTEAVRRLILHSRRHFENEERELIPMANEKIPSEILSAMGDDMMTFKESRWGVAP